ncbi:MAG: TlpA disulfide reductase family protein [Planctomycetota bacterium]
MNSQVPSGSQSTRRRAAVWLLPLLLVGGYYATMAIVRRHVDGVIQGNIGEALPAFRLLDGEGDAWTAERLRGRPAVLHFFRSRCHACDAEAAEVRAFEQATPPARAAILHVCTDGVLDFPAAETAATIARKGFARPVLLADAAFVDAFHTVRWSNVTPVTYVVDADGRIRQALRGAQTAAGLEAAVAAVE